MEALGAGTYYANNGIFSSENDIHENQDFGRFDGDYERTFFDRFTVKLSSGGWYERAKRDVESSFLENPSVDWRARSSRSRATRPRISGRRSSTSWIAAQTAAWPACAKPPAIPRARSRPGTSARRRRCGTTSICWPDSASRASSSSRATSRSPAKTPSTDRRRSSRRSTCSSIGWTTRLAMKSALRRRRAPSSTTRSSASTSRSIRPRDWSIWSIAQRSKNSSTARSTRTSSCPRSASRTARSTGSAFAAPTRAPWRGPRSARWASTCRSSRAPTI